MAKDVDWSVYAQSYDMLLSYNPAYQDLIKQFEAFLDGHGMASFSKAADIGGGTGNFSASLVARNPNISLHFLEPDEGMRKIAKRKLTAAKNPTFVDDAFENAQLEDGFDLIICTHALYTMPHPLEQLRRLRELSAPGGCLFIIDFGRPMNVSQWRNYLVRHLLKSQGVLKTAELLWRSRDLARQNRRVADHQKQGLYWLHDAKEFSSVLQEAGWQILEQRETYRGCSDLAVCVA